MKFAFAISAFVVASSTFAADAPPFPPTSVAGYTPEAARQDGLKRLKVTLTSNLGSDQQVRMGAVVACSPAACFRAQTQGFVNLASTETGKSSVAVDVLVPVGEIDSLYFEPTAGAKTLSGAIRLAQPLLLEKDFQGGEVMVVVDRVRSGEKTEYVPKEAASLPFSADWQVVYYNPKFVTTVKFDLGGELTIPAGATKQAQLFSILSRDIGEKYPSVDIYPPVKFTVPASITLKPISHPDPDPSGAYAFRGVAPVPARGTPDPASVTDQNGIIHDHLKETGHVVPGAKK